MRIFLCVTTLVLLSMPLIHAQQLTLSPSNADHAICPEEDVVFTVNNISSQCGGFLLSMEDGESTFNSTGNSFTVKADNIPQQLTIKYSPGSDPDCGGEQLFYIPVLSVSDRVPTFSECPTPLITGRSFTFTLIAELLYPFRGTLDPREVASYTWAIASGGTGWTFTTANGTNSNGTSIQRKTATFTTDNCSGATISLFATDHCGNRSLTATCQIDRFTQSPLLTGAPDYVICCNTSPIALTATQPTLGLVGYTYTWDFGNWTGTSSGTSATVIPNGSSVGSISVTAIACGIRSNTVSINIPLEIIDPPTTVIGTSTLCAGETLEYALDRGVQSCAMVSWSVSPANAVTNATGVGVSASLMPSGNFNGSATIKFNIETPCGSATRQKILFIGTPIIEDINLPSCFNMYRTYNLSVSAQGGDSYTWGVPSCAIPSEDPSYWDPSCWHIITPMPVSNPLVRIYSGERSGRISVWATNKCGTVSMNRSIIWCNPQDPGPGPFYPIAGDEGSTGSLFENEFKGEVFRMYPNPVSGHLTLEFNEDKFNELTINRVIIISTNGEIISNDFTSSKIYTKDVTDLPTGAYVVKVQNGDKVYDASFIKIE